MKNGALGKKGNQKSSRAGSLCVNTNSRTCPDSEYLMLRAHILIVLTAEMILKQLVHGSFLGSLHHVEHPPSNQGRPRIIFSISL